MDTSWFVLQNGADPAGSELLPVPVISSHLPWTADSWEACSSHPATLAASRR